MPHKLHSGIAFDSGEFMRVIDECLKLADWSGFPKRAAELKKNKNCADAASAISSKRRRSSTTA